MADLPEELGIDQSTACARVPSQSAEDFENDPLIEQAWAMKAYEHSEIYFNIICSVDPKFLKLTPNDQDIYESFRAHFPSMNVEVIDEDEMKSAKGKEKWRVFISKFQDKVEDYQFATLLRVRSGEAYSPENSTIVTRIQFYAIELARNKEGFNDGLRNTHKPNQKSKADR